MNPISFGMVGGGWRSEFYLRVVQARPDLFSMAGMVVRDPEKARLAAERWKVRTFESIAALLKSAKPEFVVASVPRTANPEVVMELVRAGMPVLSETPPALDLPPMTALYDAVRKAGGRVQVAEQYFKQPHTAARLKLVEGGLLGRVSQAQVSVGHGYHGMSLIRKFLGVGFEPPAIRARIFDSPIIAGPTRQGPPAAEELKSLPQTLAWLDWGGRLGVFDFVYSQYFGWIRSDRVLVRGERGELANDEVSWLKDFRTPIKEVLRRHFTGVGSDLEGCHLKGYTFGGDWVYSNPLAPARLADDEIAVGSCLLGMKNYLDTGKDFYSLADACQDHYLNLLVIEASTSGATLKARPQIWS